MFKSLIDLWRSSMDITELNKNKRLSSTKNLILSKDEKLFEFLSEDFRDTASHLRDTDRKIEFTFQLYAGAFSLLLTIVISFFASALGSQNWKEQYNIYIMWAVLFLLIVV